MRLYWGVNHTICLPVSWPSLMVLPACVAHHCVNMLSNPYCSFSMNHVGILSVLIPQETSHLVLSMMLASVQLTHILSIKNNHPQPNCWKNCRKLFRIKHDANTWLSAEVLLNRSQQMCTLHRRMEHVKCHAHNGEKESNVRIWTLCQKHWCLFASCNRHKLNVKWLWINVEKGYMHFRGDI